MCRFITIIRKEEEPIWAIVQDGRHRNQSRRFQASVSTLKVEQRMHQGAALLREFHAAQQVLESRVGTQRSSSGITLMYSRVEER